MISCDVTLVFVNTFSFCVDFYVVPWGNIPEKNTALAAQAAPSKEMAKSK